jgi:RecB family endonuclease NucS
MPTEMKLWRIDTERPTQVPQQKLDLESRMEEWLLHDIGLISNDLLIIGQQVRTAYGGKIDLLAIDSEGNLVVLELKKDKTPRETVTQALDYASWVQDLGYDSITSKLPTTSLKARNWIKFSKRNSIMNYQRS